VADVCGPMHVAVMADGELKRVLGLGECVFFAVGVILGAGIYAILGEAAAFAGGMLWVSFLIASVAAMLTAFAYAELVAMFPKAGGEYVYAQQAVSEKLAVVLGGLITISGVVSGATIAVGFAGYFVQLVSAPMFAASAGIVALALAINAAGIRHSSVTNILFTLIELGGLVFVVVAAAPTIGTVSLLELPPEGLQGICTGAALTFFAYVGFEDTVKLAEEVKDPERTIPRALLISTVIVGVVYLVIATVAVGAAAPGALQVGHSPMAAIVGPRYGQAGIVAISVIALFSTANSILSNMVGSSRVLHGMGEKHRALRMFHRVATKRGTPLIALAAVAALMAGMSWIGDIKTIALIGNLFIFATFLLVNVCVIVLRVRRPDARRPFRVPGRVGKVPVIPVIAGLMIAGLLGFSIRGLMITGLS
jgi:APA family basic amino acid/polyamine antiporter